MGYIVHFFYSLMLCATDEQNSILLVCYLNHAFVFYNKKQLFG